MILMILLLTFLWGCSLQQEDKLSTAEKQEQFKYECEEMAKKIRNNCPTEGFDSWYFKYSFVWNGTVKTISGEGGNCFNTESGAIELRKKNNQELKYRKIIRNSFGKEEIVESADEFCQASCESFNCPKYEKDLENFNLCGEGTSIYYPESDSLSDEKYVKEQIVSSCSRRGKFYSVEEEIIKETKIKDCHILVDSCGIINITINHSLMYCCCSCKRPEREIFFFGDKDLLKVLGKKETVTEPKPISGIENLPKELPVKEDIKKAVCGDGVISGFEICDGEQFSEQCWESIREYQERYPWLVPRCFNNCKGCEAAAPSYEK